MKVLVTGGSGVVGIAAVEALIRRGHEVRVFNRDAAADVARWEGVESRDGSIAAAGELEGAAEACEAVLHIAGIVDETPPASTFAKVNVEGTRNVVEEARRAGVKNLVFVSSLGAERGSSDYHKSKVAAEELVRAFGGSWIICRLGNVYGAGDEVISSLLKMMRATPVMPVIGSGDDPFQPLWSEDAGEALARCVERPDLRGRVLDLAGPDKTSINDILDRLSAIIGRKPARVAIPASVIGFGARIAKAAGIKLPVNESHLAMLAEHSVIGSNSEDALTAVLHLAATPLDVGLRKLADVLPEQLPADGFGGITRRCHHVDIAGSSMSAEGLFARFRLRFADLTPWTMDLSAEEGTPQTLTAGATLTMALPFRGNIQVRVVEVSDLRLTLVTVAGHPIAGGVTFAAEESGATIRFQATAYDRAANAADWLAMSTVGRPLQSSTWRTLLENVVRESGGTAPDGVHEKSDVLDEIEAQDVTTWLDGIVATHKRTGKSKSRPSRAHTAPASGRA
ncbi:MAG TPA: NAD-dependent epimerase/dehydratase family protein [Gemmatimonadaceae bacterium]|nr:NAD-dependent epimerase/dehydratase family protein [Gemmatimonadaceae bacterium]